jgi:hypothetical protein
MPGGPVPVSFLTAEQRSRYGVFNTVPDIAQLGAFFHLDAGDRRRAMTANGARNQLGWSLRLGAARFLNCFLDDPGGVPAAVVDYVAEQFRLHVELRDLGGAGWDLSAVPPVKIAALARFAHAARAQAVAELAGDRKPATLVAFAATMAPSRPTRRSRCSTWRSATCCAPRRSKRARSGCAPSKTSTPRRSCCARCG